MSRRVQTNSARRVFTHCRRQYWFKYIEKLDPIFTAPPLSFGTLIHNCLESFHKDKEVLFDGTINAWRDAYVAEFNAVNQDPDFVGDIDTEKIEGMAELAKGMMLGYVAKNAKDLNTWEILAVEEPFRFPLRTICSKCNGKGCQACDGAGLGRRSPVWDQAGKLDLVIKDEGLVWVVENKTTVETDRDRYESDLLLDTQPRSYIRAMQHLAAERDWGRVGGLIYNVLRKRLPADPHPLKCKSCKGSGQPTKKAQKEGHTECPTCNATGVIGISKHQGTDTTIAKYTEAIRRYPHLDVNDYEDVLSKLQARGDRFFWRFYHHIGPSDLNDWEAETYQVCRDIATTDRFYRNPNACSVNGRRCPYRRICTEDDPIARRNFKQRDEAHPELTAEEISG